MLRSEVEPAEEELASAHHSDKKAQMSSARNSKVFPAPSSSGRRGGILERSIQFLVRRRLIATLCVVAFAVTMGVFATRLGVDNSLEVWFVEDDPTLVSYRSFLEQFGNDEVVVIGIHNDADALDPDRLTRLWHLSEAIEAIDGIARVRSIANLATIQGSLIGPSVVPVINPPVRRDDIERARDLISESWLASSLVGEDGTTLVLYAWLDESPSIDTERGRILDDIRAATESALAAGEETASYGGVGVLHEALNQATLSDGARFIGLSYLVIAIALYFITRRLVWTLLALAAVTVADIALLGAMTLAGRSINMITIALPPLVMILGVANVVHMSTDIDISLARRRRSVNDLTRCLSAISAPCLFNMITTAVALMSLATASMAVTREYGIFAAVGVVFAFVFSIVGMAVLIPRAAHFRAPSRISERVGSTVERIMVFSVRRRVAVVVFTVLLGLVAVYGAGKIVVDTYSIDFLPETHAARRETETLEQTVGPFFPLEMTLRASEPDGWQRTGFLARLAAAQTALESDPDISRTTTAGDVLRDLYVAITGETLDRPWVPDDDDDVENLISLLERSGHASVLEDWIADDKQTLRLTAMTRMASARDFMHIADRARDVIQTEMGDGVDVAKGGYLPLYSQIIMHTLGDQIKSFGLAFLMVFLVIALVLRSWRYALAAIPPNLLPVALVLGVMGFSGVRLDIATVTVAAVVLGIIVDDSVHVLYGLRRELAAGRSFENAIRKVARAAGVAVVSTSFVFAAGFFVIALAGSNAVANPGLLTTVAVVAALVMDLVMLPAFASFLFQNQQAKESRAKQQESLVPARQQVSVSG